MFANKRNLIVFVAITVTVALICLSVIAFISIEDAKKENEAAKLKIEELNGSLDSLRSELEKTHGEVKEHKERIEKYQGIFDAWTKATPEVNEAVSRITYAYSRVLEFAYLYPQSRLEGLDDFVMDAVYGAIRSTEPDSVASELEKTLSEFERARYDSVMKDMIENINENGVIFPEDVKGASELRKYFDSFAENAEVTAFFTEQKLDRELEAIEALLDGDEESDLARELEDAVAEIKAPITLNTSLEKANAAKSKLFAALEEGDALDESTLKAWELLGEYASRKAQLEKAKKAADVINSDVSALTVAPDVATKNAIDSLEARINEWIEEFQIDEANEYLVKGASAVRTDYENAVAELRALYGAFKKAVENIGEVNASSGADIDAAFDAFKKIKDFKDTDTVLGLEAPNTVAELYAILEKAYGDYNYLNSLINAIRAEIDRIHGADPDVTHAEIDRLNDTVEELLSIEVSPDVLNTENTDYVSLLGAARLLPHKNDAFREIKSAYDESYAKARDDRDIILALVATKDAALNEVEGSDTTDGIRATVEKAKEDFEKCFE